MALRFVLLTQLANGEQSGYDIVKSFERAAGHFWSATHQQVYRELAQLHEKKWVSMRLHRQLDKPDKKLYRTSKAGIEMLREWIQTPLPKPQIRDPFLVKVQAAAAIGESDLDDAFGQSEASTQEALTTYREIESRVFTPAPSSDTDLQFRALYVALRKGIIGAQAHLTWLQEAREVLHDS